MTTQDVILDGLMLIFFLVIVTGVALPFSNFFVRVFAGDMSRGIPGHIEKAIYGLIDTGPDKEDGWKGYTRDMLVFNSIGFVILLILLLLQGFLPFNPQNFGAFDLFTAINAATSFVTNTNWQVYSGETTASYLTQMAGFTVQNFLSSATGICIAIAVMRGITRQSTDRIGNFWVDMTRCTLYILLPIAFVFAIVLASQGVIQNLDPYVQVTGYGPTGQRTIAMGPIASQEAIKELGTNGGGFFNANSAHPYENPTPLTSLIEIFLILLIPATMPLVFGRMSGRMWQGWMIYTVMLVLFLGGFCTLYAAELAANPLVKELGVSGISMEGKEVRFGLWESSLFATSTTATSCGAVNCMHDSLTPLGGLVPIFMILLGEVAFGGVGSGFYTMTVTLIAGLLFPDQAHGSLIVDNENRTIGSTLIGQNFTTPQYFQSRPSASGYNATSSGGSNLGPTNPVLLELVNNRTNTLWKAGITGPIPSDLVMASASGLDPHISLKSALIQVPAIAKARNLPEEKLKSLVLAESVNSPFTGAYVNVLSLNRALDEMN